MGAADRDEQTRYVFEQLAEPVSGHANLETELSDPTIHADQDKARTIGRRYAELGPIVSAYQEWLRVGDDLKTAQELSGEDASFRAEATELEAQLEDVTARLRVLLLPTDPNDDKGVILEVQA